MIEHMNAPTYGAPSWCAAYGHVLTWNSSSTALPDAAPCTHCRQWLPVAGGK